MRIQEKYIRRKNGTKKPATDKTEEKKLVHRNEDEISRKKWAKFFFNIHNFFPYRYMERQVFAFHFFDMTRKEEKKRIFGETRNKSLSIVSLHFVLLMFISHLISLQDIYIKEIFFHYVHGWTWIFLSHLYNAFLLLGHEVNSFTGLAVRQFDLWVWLLL